MTTITTTTTTTTTTTSTMKTPKIEKFFKKFIDSETDRILERLKNLSTSATLEKFRVLRKSESSHGDDCDVSQDVTLDDIHHVLELILRHGIDFRRSTNESVLNLWQKTRATKDNSKSEALREAGNKLLNDGQLDEAVAQYNEAVLFAQLNSKSYALALANRALAWMKFQVGIMLVSFQLYQRRQF